MEAVPPSKAMKGGIDRSAWLWLAGLAIVLGLALYISREYYAGVCREGVLSLQKPDVTTGEPKFDDFIKSQREEVRKNAEDCYRKGLIPAPPPP